MRVRELALCQAIFSPRVFGSFLPMQKEQTLQHPLPAKSTTNANGKKHL
ncbi:MAG: hypothetical protein ACJAT4_002585 [Granulosicoccus sp.]|jgi:hypothetical protein